MNCPACQSDKRNTNNFISVKKDFSLSGYNYSQCADCLTIFLQDEQVQDQETLSELHKEYWYSSSNFKFAPEKDIAQRLLLCLDTAEEFISFLSTIPKSILDIGCGNGELVASFHEKGFKAYGVEPDSKAFEVTTIKPELRDKLFCGSIESLDKLMLSLERVDLVVLSDVLEHLWDPLDSIKRIKQFALSHEGGAVLIQVPSGSALQMKVLKEYAWNFMAPFHRTLFTKEGLEKLLKRAGAKEIKHFYNKRKIWGWTRGLAWKAGWASQHEILRKKSQLFCSYDYLIDDCFENLSHELKTPPSLFAIAYF